MKNIFKVTALCLAIATISGCSVSPESLTYKERHEFYKQNLELQKKFTIPVDGPISMSEAMARTVVSNIEHRIQMMEHALSQAEFTKAKNEMLPQLRAQAGITHRNLQSSSRSINLDTGEVSTGGYTSSEERTHNLGDITFSWNLLDFGISYYSAKQQADAVLIRQEMQRSVIQDLLYKVRGAYWKAYIASYFSPKIKDFVERSKKILNDSKTAEALKLMSPIESLQYQKSLLGLISQMEDLLYEMDVSEVELRSLMNLPLDAKLELVSPGEPLKIKNVELPSLSKMVEVALDKRPECRQEMYRTRASLNEVKKAYLKILPGVELRSSFNFDTNTYLKDNHWWNIWGGLTANIVDIMTTPERIDLAKKTVDMAQYKNLGVQLAVILQVQMAAKEFYNASNVLNRSFDLNEIENKLNDMIHNQLVSTTGTQMEAIKSEASEILSELNLYKSYAVMQNVYGSLLKSLGLDLVDISDDENLEFKDLVKSFESQSSFDLDSLDKNISKVLEENQKSLDDEKQ